MTADALNGFLLRARRDRLFAALLLILVLGLSLRLYCLECESLWIDEGFTVRWAMSGPLGIIFSAAGDVHPPLYFLALFSWMQLLGDSEFSIRLLSALFGVLSLFLIYRLGSLALDRKTGVLGSLLLSVSLLHVYYSQEARPYSMAVFLTLLSMYFFLRLLEERSRRNTLLYVTSSALLLYTHFFALFIILVQNVCILSGLLRPKGMSIEEWMRIQYRLLIAFLPWLVILAFQAMRAASGSSPIGWMPLPTIGLVFTTFFEFFGYLSGTAGGFLPNDLFELSPLSMASSAAALLAISLAAGAFFSFGKGRVSFTSWKRKGKIFLLVWLAVPIAVPFVLSYLLMPLYWPRFMILASPALYLLAASGLRRISNRHLALALVLALVALSLVNAARYYTETNKEQWREAAACLNSNAMPGDMLLFYKGFTIYGPMEYYLKVPGLVKVRLDEQGIENLTSMLENQGRVWLIVYREQELVPRPGDIVDVWERISATHAPADEREFVRIGLYLFEPR